MNAHIPLRFPDETCVVLGTGPGLTPEVRDRVSALRRYGRVRIAAMNNTFQHFDAPIDIYTACDPAWWQHFGAAFHEWHVKHKETLAYHWDLQVCNENALRYVPGRWGDGLSLDPAYIHYGHSSGYQLINLAVLHGCRRIVLVGFDMRYPPGVARHYFNDVSDADGEYPPALRKWSSFSGLLACYQTIAKQMEATRKFEIINCTPCSAMSWFPIRKLEEVLP